MSDGDGEGGDRDGGAGAAAVRVEYRSADGSGANAVVVAERSRAVCVRVGRGVPGLRGVPARLPAGARRLPQGPRLPGRPAPRRTHPGPRPWLPASLAPACAPWRAAGGAFPAQGAVRARADPGCRAALDAGRRQPEAAGRVPAAPHPGRRARVSVWVSGGAGGGSQATSHVTWNYVGLCENNLGRCRRRACRDQAA